MWQKNDVIHIRALKQASDPELTLKKSTGYSSSIMKHGFNPYIDMNEELITETIMILRRTSSC